jgi:phosphoserine phosphatase
LPTNTAAYASCADEILNIYDNETTRAAVPAFNPANARRMEPAFAWTPQLMAGYTHAELQTFTMQAITPMLAAAMDATQTIGTTTENGWLRIYDQQKDLIQAAQTRGFDVWIITASPQDVIGTAAAMVGVPFDHVIGIRSTLDSNGKTTYAFEGCGGIADGQQQVIPYIQGKRCYVNKVAFGDATATAWQRRLDGQRQFFASGDSDSDVEFLRDAHYKLVINRNKGDLMCHAYYDEHDTWRVNPMFIEPKAAKASAYTCSTTTFTDEKGGSGPSRDEGGNAMPDQTDTVN